MASPSKVSVSSTMSSSKEMQQQITSLLSQSSNILNHQLQSNIQSLCNAHPPAAPTLIQLLQLLLSDKSTVSPSAKPEPEPQSRFDPGQPLYILHDLPFLNPRKKLDLAICTKALVLISPTALNIPNFPCDSNNYTTLPTSFISNVLVVPTPGKQKPNSTYILFFHPTPDSKDPREPILFTLDDSNTVLKLTTSPQSLTPPFSTSTQIPKTDPKKPKILECLSRIYPTTNILTPSPTTFTSRTTYLLGSSGPKSPFIPAHYKSKEGYLYFLPTALFYGFKKHACFLFPLERVRRMDVRCVTSRTFTLVVEMEGSPEWEFEMVEGGEFEAVQGFVGRMGIPFGSVEEEDVSTKEEKDGGAEGEVGKVDKGNGKMEVVEEDDDEEEEDGDYNSDNAEEDDEESVDEEYDSNHESGSAASGSDDDDDGDDDDDDDNEGEARAKKRKNDQGSSSVASKRHKADAENDESEDLEAESEDEGEGEGDEEEEEEDEEEEDEDEVDELAFGTSETALIHPPFSLIHPPEPSTAASSQPTNQPTKKTGPTMNPPHPSTSSSAATAHTNDQHHHIKKPRQVRSSSLLPPQPPPPPPLTAADSSSSTLPAQENWGGDYLGCTATGVDTTVQDQQQPPIVGSPFREESLIDSTSSTFDESEIIDPEPYDSDLSRIDSTGADSYISSKSSSVISSDRAQQTKQASTTGVSRYMKAYKGYEPKGYETLSLQSHQQEEQQEKKQQQQEEKSSMDPFQTRNTNYNQHQRVPYVSANNNFPPPLKFHPPTNSLFPTTSFPTTEQKEGGGFKLEYTNLNVSSLEPEPPHPNAGRYPAIVLNPTGGELMYSIFRNGDRDARICVGSDKDAVGYEMEYQFGSFSRKEIHMHRLSKTGVVCYVIQKEHFDWDMSILSTFDPGYSVKMVKVGGKYDTLLVKDAVRRREHRFRAFNGRLYGWRGEKLGNDLRLVSYPSQEVVATIKRDKKTYRQTCLFEISPAVEDILELVLASGFAADEWEQAYSDEFLRVFP
ncbi:hypothetical protein HDV05_005877 [Chytridiales sp. JEL 0842]|nr:hypothetical protein HDV05_005877 [Chytridiales sp. JEL 0842]